MSDWLAALAGGVGGAGILGAIIGRVLSVNDEKDQQIVRSPQHEPAPGMFGLTRIGGVLGFFIGLGQFLVGDASRYSHAFIVLDDGTVMEAMPSGARITPLSEVMLRRPLAFSWAIHLTEEQASRVVSEARKCEGVKYGFSAYLYLALTFFKIKVPALRKYLERNGRMICSQLVDHVYARAGVQLFNDGRAPFDVTPGDLANILIEECWPDDVPGRHAADK